MRGTMRNRSKRARLGAWCGMTALAAALSLASNISPTFAQPYDDGGYSRGGWNQDTWQDDDDDDDARGGYWQQPQGNDDDSWRRQRSQDDRWRYHQPSGYWDQDQQVWQPPVNPPPPWNYYNPQPDPPAYGYYGQPYGNPGYSEGY